MMCIIFIVIVDDGESPPSSPPVDARRRGEGIIAIVSMINGASIATIAMIRDNMFIMATNRW